LKLGDRSYWRRHSQLVKDRFGRR